MTDWDEAFKTIAFVDDTVSKADLWLMQVALAWRERVFCLDIPYLTFSNFQFSK